MSRFRLEALALASMVTLASTVTLALALAPAPAQAQESGPPEASTHQAPSELPEVTVPGSSEDAPSELPAVSGEPAPRRSRVGVILLPRGLASPEMTDSLTELLIAAVASRGAVEIVGKEEFQAALGRDEAGTLACIESDACVGRMGRELRVSELIAGTLHESAEAPDRFRFELYRLDVESGSARGRVARETEGGLGGLLAALQSSIAELYVERVEPGAIVVSASPRDAALALDQTALEAAGDGSFRRDFLVPGEHVLTGRASGHAPLSRRVVIEPGTTLMLTVELMPRPPELHVSTLTLGLAGGGAALAGIAIGLGAASQSSPEGELGMRQTDSFYDARGIEALVANVLFASSGAVLVAAVVSLVLDLTTSEESAALARAFRGEAARW